jgi:peptidoglycan/xylan/chitin deacetylase (PgdA/CDA1 family)
MAAEPRASLGYMRTVRSMVAPAMKSVCLRTGVYSAIRRLKPSRQVGILRYHAVADPAACWYAEPSICLSPKDFAAQVEYLTRHYRVLPLDQIVRAFRSRRPLPSDVVALTFDDGYADNFEAARILARFGATATFYLTAGCIDGERPFWVSELRALIAAIGEPRLTLEPRGAPALTVSLGDQAARRSASRQITRMIKSQPIPVREALLDQLRDAAGRPRIPSPMLTWAQVREMHAMGMTIGGHTLTHANLPSAGPEDARFEIAACRARLEQELRADVTMFAYPNGGANRYFTPAIERMVEEAGFEAATTSTNGFADPLSDPYALERIQTGPRLEDVAFALEVERFAFKPRPRPAAPQESTK